jgi:hypothetical protein
LLCNGGGASAAVRLSPAWQLLVDVGGCKIAGLEAGLSGDSLTYMAGPRRLHAVAARWTAQWQLLVGGHKMSGERMWPDKKRLLNAAALAVKNAPPSHSDYTEQVEASGFALATGCGLNYRLNRALAVRVAELSYLHSWTGPRWGTAYRDSLKLESGLILRMGTW